MLAEYQFLKTAELKIQPSPWGKSKYILSAIRAIRRMLNRINNFLQLHT